MPALLAALLLAAQQPGGAAENWGSERSELTASREYARSKATCRRLGDPRPPAADQPGRAQRQLLKSCDSQKLYYGQGARPDYVRARQCAFIEADGADDEVFGGSTILMQVYANGLGATRNLDLATAYACNIDGAPAERDGRVNHLQDLKSKPSPKRFDYCDDITSGLAEGFCQSRDSDLQAVGRDAKLGALAARLPPAARPLYAPMKRAFDAFVDLHGDGEVDLSGTARAMLVIQEEDATRDAFTADLRRLLNGGWPAATSAQAATADAALNAAYREALAFTASKDNFSTVKPDGIRKAQRAWLAYRDAFQRFAAAASPRVGASAVAARLTAVRTKQLTDWTQ